MQSQQDSRFWPVAADACRSGGSKFADVHVRAGSRGFFGCLEKTRRGRLVHVLLPAVFADLGGHPAHDERRPFALERYRGPAGAGLAVLADHTEHLLSPSKTGLPDLLIGFVGRTRKRVRGGRVALTPRGPRRGTSRGSGSRSARSRGP